MKRIAYLCSQVTIPGSPIRRSDAFEHDRTMDSLRPAFTNREMDLVEVCWDDTEAQWESFDAVIIGTCWDYWDRNELFLSTLDEIEIKTKLFNSAPQVRWNSNKNYLKELAKEGAELIPTAWIDQPTIEALENSFDALNSDDLVAKRQVGAGADGQFRIKRGGELPQLSQPMMVQPFMPSILSEGELSLIFIDGQFSHALIKRAADGDYRIQSSYGGTETAIEPEPDDIEDALIILNALAETPLYARVDMLRSDNGKLFLMELELIEPYLYPLEGPDLGTRMAEAIIKRIC